MFRAAVLRQLIAVAGLVLTVIGAMAGTTLGASAQADFPKLVRVSSGQAAVNRPLPVGIGRSVIIQMPENVADVLVSDPAVADAVVRTARKVFVLGIKQGQANLVLFGKGGRQLASFDITVAQDTSDLNRLIARLIPGSHVFAENTNGSVILSGEVPTPLDAQNAVDLAKGFIGGDKPNVINMLAVRGKEQVFLKVTIAEVERTLTKKLGIDFKNVSIGAGPYTAAYNGNILDQAIGSLGFAKGATKISAVLNALQEDGVVRTLAEPTLTAISGENASFLVGGEFPIPVSEDNGKISVTFKPFGIGLDFTPVVMSGGRISLRVKTEVSELTNDGAVDIGALTISALKVRRAESTVELPSGGALVMAGLLKDNYQQTLRGLPGLSKLPILGALFKSNDFQRNQTELVVFVSPYLVKPVASSKLVRPDENLAPGSDADQIFFDRLNRVYRASGKQGGGTYHGQVGFIYE